MQYLFALFIDAWHSSLLRLVVGFLLATYAFFWGLLYLTQDSKEPPLAPCSIPIPFIGPIIEMRSKGTKYHQYMKSKFPKPIYTVRILKSHLYLINSTDLITAVQRHPKALSYDPPLIDGLRKLLGISQSTLSLMGYNVTPQGVESAFLARLARAVYPSLSSGDSLQAMNKMSLSLIGDALSELVSQSGSRTVNLFEWIQKTLIVATSTVVFGPDSPLRDPVNLAKWIEFETEGMPHLAMGVPPRFVSKSALSAREDLVSAFTAFLEKDPTADGASEFFQRRISFYKRERLPSDDIARLAVADTMALSSNLVPTVFWMLYHIFSDASLLDHCRAEISQTVQDENKNKIHYDALKTSCPVLQSTLKEIFRFHGVGLVPRRALENVLLDDRWLIKKGGMILIPYTVQHFDKENWGPRADEFLYWRHLKNSNSGIADEPGGHDGLRKGRHEGAALRGFGYGSHLCPGRHLAMAEVLGFVALVVMRFDLVPDLASMSFGGQGNGSGWPGRMSTDKYQVSGVSGPDREVRVEFRPRGGVSQTGWMVEFTGSPNG